METVMEEESPVIAAVSPVMDTVAPVMETATEEQSEQPRRPGQLLRQGSIAASVAPAGRMLLRQGSMSAGPVPAAPSQLACPTPDTPPAGRQLTRQTSQAAGPPGATRQLLRQGSQVAGGRQSPPAELSPNRQLQRKGTVSTVAEIFGKKEKGSPSKEKANPFEDKNANGTPTDLVSLVRNSAAAFLTADVNKDQALTFEEFVTAIPKETRDQHPDASLKALFEAADHDGSGDITRDEFFFWSLSNAMQFSGGSSGMEEVIRSHTHTYMAPHLPWYIYIYMCVCMYAGSSGLCVHDR